MTRPRLTRREKEALIAVVNERLAGSTEDLRDALGCLTLDEAIDIEDALDSALAKLQQMVRQKPALSLRGNGLSPQ